MINKMISNSDILSDLFNKKQYNFLQEIDKKFEIIEEQRNELLQKECDIKELFIDIEVEEEKKEKVILYINSLYERLDDFEIRIKELNQAIIRLIVDKETEYKYQTQDLKQMVCFAKDKIKEYMNLEEKFIYELQNIETKALNLLEEKEEKVEIIEKEDKKEETIEIAVQEEKENDILNLFEANEEEEKEIEVPRRIRQGSALNEIKALKEIEKLEKKSKKEELEKNIQISEEDISYSIENNVLLISEKVGKIFLPYKKADLQNYLMSYPNEYGSYDEVIEKEYILPLDEFMKNQTLSRFREMYDLIRNKELKSMIEAMKISTKFMFRYELNPAIIAACNSKEELDKYLECLEQNKLEEFDIFDIKFELNLL